MFLTKNEVINILSMLGKNRGLQIFIGHTNNHESHLFFEKTMRQ
jgi:hypothetical protein